MLVDFKKLALSTFLFSYPHKAFTWNPEINSVTASAWFRTLSAFLWCKACLNKFAARSLLSCFNIIYMTTSMQRRRECKTRQKHCDAQILLSNISCPFSMHHIILMCWGCEHLQGWQCLCGYFSLLSVQICGPDILGRRMAIIGESSDSSTLAQDCQGADAIIHAASCSVRGTLKCKCMFQKPKGVRTSLLRYPDSRQAKEWFDAYCKQPSTWAHICSQSADPSDFKGWVLAFCIKISRWYSADPG